MLRTHCSSNFLQVLVTYLARIAVAPSSYEASRPIEGQSHPNTIHESYKQSSNSMAEG